MRARLLKIKNILKVITTIQLHYSKEMGKLWNNLTEEIKKLEEELKE